MRIGIKDREKIISHLPRGYAKTIALELGVHRNTVYNVLYRGHSNMEIAQKLVDMATDEKAKDSLIVDGIEQLSA